MTKSRLDYYYTLRSKLKGQLARLTSIQNNDVQTIILICILYFIFPESTRPKGNNRRRDYPRGGYDVGPVAAPSMASGGYGGDPRKQFKGQGGRRQQRRSQTSQSLSSPGFGSDPFAGGASKPSVMLEDEFEVGSVFNSGSKKQNISHLMNFQFEPRGSQTNKKSGSNNFFRKSSGESEFCMCIGSEFQSL